MIYDPFTYYYLQSLGMITGALFAPFIVAGIVWWGLIQ